MARPFDVLICLSLLAWPTAASSQQAQPAAPTDLHEHVAVSAPLLTPTREATGTSWLPDVAPMYGVHRPWRGWDIRLNGAVFVQAFYEPVDRHRTGGAGTRQAGSGNWVMFMARRGLGGGRFGIRTMLSAEPWSIPGCGSLSLLATGEVCADDTIHDRQQPHDLVMELALDYDRALVADWRWQVYAGLAGEPAFGPPAYPHRASAISNPLAPVTHHWLEATRVSFGVLTVGVHNQRWKAEGSVFHGREPDESRADLDLGRFDSVGGRLSFLPSDRLALQVSVARLREARSDFPVDLPDPFTRMTVSAVYYRPLSREGLWATTVAIGAMRGREIVAGGIFDATTAGGLIESSVTLAERHTLFGRAELGDMPAHHLHANEYSTSAFTLAKLQFGYVRYLHAAKGVMPGIGGTVAVSLLPTELAPRYSGRAAPSFGVFFSLQAAKHKM